MPLVFEWDLRKARSNLRKHGIRFDEACTVFDDDAAEIFSDEDHSNGEEREIIVGRSIFGRVLLISFTERSFNRIRIISARKATRRELKGYEEKINS
jgi:uncharacterized DUF497 family protein